MRLHVCIIVLAIISVAHTRGRGGGRGGGRGRSRGRSKTSGTNRRAGTIDTSRTSQNGKQFPNRPNTKVSSETIKNVNLKIEAAITSTLVSFEPRLPRISFCNHYSLYDCIFDGPEISLGSQFPDQLEPCRKYQTVIGCTRRCTDFHRIFKESLQKQNANVSSLCPDVISVDDGAEKARAKTNMGVSDEYKGSSAAVRGYICILLPIVIYFLSLA